MTSTVMDALDKKAWPSRGGPKYDEQGDFVQEEVKATVDSITDNGNANMLTDRQACTLQHISTFAVT